MPALDRFYREASSKASILAVVPTTSEGGMRDLLMAGRYTLPIMLDQGDVASGYKVRYVPTLFVIDSAGNLAQRIVGGVDFARLNQLVDAVKGG